MQKLRKLRLQRSQFYKKRLSESSVWPSGWERMQQRYFLFVGILPQIHYLIKQDSAPENMLKVAGSCVHFYFIYIFTNWSLLESTINFLKHKWGQWIIFAKKVKNIKDSWYNHSQCLIISSSRPNLFTLLWHLVEKCQQQDQNGKNVTGIKRLHRIGLSAFGIRQRSCSVPWKLQQIGGMENPCKKRLNHIL